MTTSNPFPAGHTVEPFPPWCGRLAGRQSNAVSAYPRDSWAGRAGPGSTTKSVNVCGHARPCGAPAPARPREWPVDLDRGAPGRRPCVHSPSRRDPGAGSSRGMRSFVEADPQSGKLTSHAAKRLTSAAARLVA
jgi:hypothetical protein